VHNTEIYLIEAAGASDSLHHTPKAVIEVV
jgi:hypothetical protein